MITPIPKILAVFTAGLMFIFSVPGFPVPATFEQAKIEGRQYVYHDRTQAGTFYCGCEWQWAGRSGGRADLASCGYQIRSQEHRAIRTEWEHVVPASNFGRARQCWQNGGRKNCNRTDPIFNAMEADLHNLTPTIGEVNADRSNFRFGVLPFSPQQHGACDFKVDFQNRVAEPRDQVKGQVARIYFYMHDRYNLPMSDQQQRLFMAWNHQFPPTAWELERNQRVAARMGHGNPFVTGERAWTLGHRNHAEGVVTASHPASAPQAQSTPRTQAYAATEVVQQGAQAIRGNQNSKVYHLPAGCPSYDQVSPRNVVEFRSEQEAASAGYRKAGNCR